MKAARTGLITAAVLAVATMVMAQAKADFSGSWAPDAAAAAPATPPAGGGGGGGGRGMGGPMTVTQTATELSVQREGRSGATTMVYKLDGTPSKITMGQNEATATAKWDGDKLVITTKSTGQDGAAMEATQTWSMAGGVLTIERTGGRGAGKTTYKKTT